MENLNVLYEDNHIIVVVKPVNIPSQGDKTGDEDMPTIMHIAKNNATNFFIFWNFIFRKRRRLCRRWRLMIHSDYPRMLYKLFCCWAVRR